MVKIHLQPKAWVWTFSQIIFIIHEQNGWKQILEIKRSLSLFFPGTIMHSMGKELKFPWETNVFNILFDCNFFI
jgi:hypothetical protein